MLISYFSIILLQAINKNGLYDREEIIAYDNLPYTQEVYVFILGSNRG